MKSENRDQFFQLRMSKSEKDWIKNKAKKTGLTMAEVIRSYGLNEYQSKEMPSGDSLDFLIDKRVYCSQAFNDDGDDLEDMYGTVTRYHIEDYYFFEKGEEISIRIYFNNEEDGFEYYSFLEYIKSA